MLTVVGYTTGTDPIVFPLPTDSGPFPATASALYFSEVGGPPQTTNEGLPTFSGTPMLTDSNGTTIVGGTLVPIENYQNTIASLYGYSSSISGLVANVKYGVSFASLRWDQTGCTYGAQSAGSFSTN